MWGRIPGRQGSSSLNLYAMMPNKICVVTPEQIKGAFSLKIILIRFSTKIRIFLKSFHFKAQGHFKKIIRLIAPRYSTD